MIGLYTPSFDGHRKSYFDLISSLYPSVRLTKRKLILHKGSVFFLMIEDSFLLYFAVSIIRYIFGLKTIGLLFRPLPVVECKSLRHLIKKCSLILLKHLSCSSTLLILPSACHKNFYKICDDWIYDLQLWDLDFTDYRYFLEVKNNKGSSRLLTDIQTIGRGRLILSSIGAQSEIKGFDSFCECYIEHPSIRSKFLFVYAGKIESPMECVQFYEKHGGFGENRFIEDHEIFDLYACSNVVWALYSNKYDQASGIFGRAVQLGVPVIVREDSLLHKFCLIEDIKCIATNKDNLIMLLNAEFPKANPNIGLAYRNRFRNFSIEKLNNLLG